jgi:hypothetical protein
MTREQRWEVRDAELRSVVKYLEERARFLPDDGRDSSTWCHVKQLINQLKRRDHRGQE